MAYTPRQLKRFMSLWPPLLGAGVKVREFADDGSRVVVTHKPNKLTKNAVGTAFGGTIMSMTDPFYMLASMSRLGRNYNVWDIGAEVSFMKPGRGTITADMRIDDATYDLIREKTADGSKYLHWFEVDVTDDAGETVAKVRRQVYYRRKKTS
ncbi:DUF4442 domain-containing protein [Corynebacterium sp.]|jgi:acyl-coenzyme A thioesterase PaaI-like protein|uniref:DUF4442 domain-containing protein n=1 Tax=Corynebacterium sp. TaxID=1720 RepID=UPI0025C0AE5C|nr:DUF4442 domain-containing protein [Corynebacterium sp.]